MHCALTRERNRLVCCMGRRRRARFAAFAVRAGAGVGENPAKTLINDPRAVVVEMPGGPTYAHLKRARLEGERVVLRADIDAFGASGRVALVSRGGSGRGPAHAGYAGEGLLTAAVRGDVFTSPSSDAVLPALGDARLGDLTMRDARFPAAETLAAHRGEAGALERSRRACHRHARSLGAEAVLVRLDALRGALARPDR